MEVKKLHVTCCLAPKNSKTHVIESIFVDVAIYSDDVARTEGQLGLPSDRGQCEVLNCCVCVCGLWVCPCAVPPHPHWGSSLSGHSHTTQPSSWTLGPAAGPAYSALKPIKDKTIKSLKSIDTQKKNKIRRRDPPTERQDPVPILSTGVLSGRKPCCSSCSSVSSSSARISDTMLQGSSPVRPLRCPL